MIVNQVLKISMAFAVWCLVPIQALADFTPIAGSYQKHYSQKEETNHWVVLGAVEKVKGIITPEREARVEGKVSRWMWQIPVGQTSEEVFEHAMQQFDESVLPLYQCSGRSCGSSNELANKIFQQSMLYGRDEFQYYWVGFEQNQDKTEPATLWIVYAIQRGNQRVFQYLEKVALAPGQASLFTEDAQRAQAKVLKEQGYIVMQELKSSKSAALSAESVRWLKDLLHKNSNTQYALVVHRYNKKAEASSLVSQSQQEAQALLEQMAGANGFIQKLYVHGAGAMMPRAGMSDRIELVLINK